MAENTSQTYYIVVNIRNRTLTLYRNGVITKVYPIAVGKSATPTPKGTFQIKNKAVNPGGPYGARWMGLTATGGSYGIHGTDNPSSIGKNVSNGCIRMYNKDVIEIFNQVSVNTVVKIL